jgi:hypothetical protein
MTKHFIRALLGVAMLAVWAGITIVPASAGDVTLYAQPPGGSGNLYASQNDTKSGGYGNFATVYDDFTLASTSSINMVKWTGGYYNSGPGTITGFTVDFWANNSSGAPGASVASIAGAANETFLGGIDYSYSLNLGTPFTALAGTQYWLSVVPDMGFPPQWGWATGTGGDGTAYQDYFGTLSQQGTDFAFSLVGNPVSATPEPGSMLLMATFLMALGPIVRKKLW